MKRPRIVRLHSATSTQDIARGLPIGSVVVADFQTAGRGRLDHRWEAPPGTALLVSFVLAPNPVLSLAAGVAAAEACGSRVRLKWPNDLLLDGRKVGGILVEATPDRAVCGIGINLTWAPPEGARLDRDREPLLAELRLNLERWAAEPPRAVIDRWRSLSDTIGRRVRVDLPTGAIEGVADDIDDTGLLVVDGRAISAGSVTVLR